MPLVQAALIGGRVELDHHFPEPAGVGARILSVQLFHGLVV